MSKNSCTIQIQLSEAQRRDILRRYPPHHQNVACRHITLEYGVPDHTVVPEGKVQIGIFGRAWDDRTDALLVTLDGKETRPDGRPYHITLSLADGVAPGEAKHLVGKKTIVFDRIDITHSGQPELRHKGMTKIERARRAA